MTANIAQVSWKWLHQLWDETGHPCSIQRRAHVGNVNATPGQHLIAEQRMGLIGNGREWIQLGSMIPDRVHQHIVHVHRGVVYTITFVLAMFILRPIRLLSSDSSCNICCSSCVVSVHKNMSSEERRLEKKFSVYLHSLGLPVYPSKYALQCWVRWCPHDLLLS